MNELVEVIEKAKIEQGTAKMLQESFNPLFTKAQEWKLEADKIIVTDESQTEMMAKAREIRLSLQKVRTDADKKRIALKEDSLRYGKAVQGIYNVIEFLVKPIEKHLENQEKFIERQEEQKRLVIKQKRESEILPYAEFVPGGFDFGIMTEEDYQRLLAGFKIQYQLKQDAIAKAEAEKIEAEKKAKEEQERIRIENEKLKAEKEAREKEIAAERAANEKKLKAEKEAREKEIAAERAANEKKLKAEKEAREKAEKEKKEIEEKQRKEKEIETNRIKAEKEAENKRIAAEKEAERKAQNAPDREKIVKFIADLSLLEYPDVKADEAKKIIDFARIEIGKLSAQLSNKISQL